MVEQTEYYDILGVTPDATRLVLRKAYLFKAFFLHPVQNADDLAAKEKFQAISVAYQVIGNDDLRKIYDEMGKEASVPDSGFMGPQKFYLMEYLGFDAFNKYIGEISFLEDRTKTVEITAKHAKENKEEDEERKPARPSSATPPTATAKTVCMPIRPRLASDASDANDSDADKWASAKAEIERKRKNKELTKEQGEELEALGVRPKRARLGSESVEVLTQELVKRLSLWTETSGAFTMASIEKIRFEAEYLKLGRFGVDVLHTIGIIYESRGQGYIRAQRWLKSTSVCSCSKDKRPDVLDEELAVEIRSGVEALGIEKRMTEREAENERRALGKIFAARWRKYKSEISDVLRDVCDKFLHDPRITQTEREERAYALIMVGAIFNAVKRSIPQLDE